jgi:hypothetical protein
MSDEYVKRSEILETRWKCPSCGADNRGRDMICASCSAPKDEAAGYELDAAATAVTDAAQVADAKAGEHWVCAYCEKENRGRSRICAFCNADQTKRERKAAPAAAATPAKPGNRLLGCGLVLAGAAAFVLFLVWLGSPREVDARITALQWTQTLELRRKTVVHKEAWHDEVPGAAFEKTCADKYRRDREVVDHYRTVSKTRRVKYESGSHEDCRTVTKNLGNGYAERQEVCTTVPEYDYRTESYTEEEPVYRTEKVFEPYCRFDVFEWPAVKTAARTGAGTTGLVWPLPEELDAPGCLPCTPAGDHPSEAECCARVGAWVATFEDPAEKDPAKQRLAYNAASAEEFATFSLGQTRKLRIDDDGKVALVPVK